MRRMTDDFERAVRFVQAMQDRMAERVVPFRLGTALFNDRLPLAWQLNFVRLGRDESGLTAEDVAAAVVFAASPAASLITGTSLVIDGGWTAQ